MESEKIVSLYTICRNVKLFPKIEGTNYQIITKSRVATRHEIKDIMISYLLYIQASYFIFQNP